MGKPLRRHVQSYRSGLEKANAERLTAQDVPYEYEGFSIPFLQPEQRRTYKPDFLLMSNGILVETKGQFVTADRKKHLLVKEQHPLLDIRFVFSNPNAKIYKGSPTTHAMWAEQNGFKWASKCIPIAWTKEATNAAAINYIKSIRGNKCKK